MFIVNIKVWEIHQASITCTLVDILLENMCEDINAKHLIQQQPCCLLYTLKPIEIYTKKNKKNTALTNRLEYNCNNA